MAVGWGRIKSQYLTPYCRQRFHLAFGLVKTLCLNNHVRYYSFITWPWDFAIEYNGGNFVVMRYVSMMQNDFYFETVSFKKFL